MIKSPFSLQIMDFYTIVLFNNIIGDNLHMVLEKISKLHR